MRLRVDVFFYDCWIFFYPQETKREKIEHEMPKENTTTIIIVVVVVITITK